MISTSIALVLLAVSKASQYVTVMRGSQKNSWGSWYEAQNQAQDNRIIDIEMETQSIKILPPLISCFGSDKWYVLPVLLRGRLKSAFRLWHCNGQNSSLRWPSQKFLNFIWIRPAGFVTVHILYTERLSRWWKSEASWYNLWKGLQCATNDKLTSQGLVTRYVN